MLLSIVLQRVRYELVTEQQFQSRKHKTWYSFKMFSSSQCHVPINTRFLLGDYPHQGFSSGAHWYSVCAVLCLVAQSCPALCHPMDCSPPGSSIHWHSPGKTTGVDCHALLQGIFPTQESNLRQILYQLSYQGSSPEHNGGYLEAIQDSRLE